jgi:hypothetical protein
MSPATQTDPLGQTLPHLLEAFLAGARGAVVLEDGRLLFDLTTARYSVTADRGKCLLHLWSPERNAVRRVLAVEAKNGVLRMQVQRFGQVKPNRLEICATRDRRAPSARKAGRTAYQQRLQRVLERTFPGFRLERVTTAADLERSFGPVHTRALLRRGATAMAVVGTNADETQASIDAAVTVGMLWLDICRQKFAQHGHVEGLMLFVPAGRSAMAAARLACLHHQAAKWQLFELDESELNGPERLIEEVDCRDQGNVATRLVHCPSEAAAHERFAASIERVRASAPEAQITVLSPGEISFRVHGLEFARARVAPPEAGFRMGEEIVFGVGAAENVLSEDTAAEFHSLVRRVVEARHPAGDHNHPLWRMHPERWLESLVIRDVHAIDATLDPGCVYSQVPAFSASDRAMIDVLAVTRGGRLTVIELKAEEDMHLPVQGLDYWSRVKWHHQRGEFQRYGYFPGLELSPEPPLLYLVAPALRLHSTTDTLLRYMSPEIDCIVVGIDERWRDSGVRMVFRKRRVPQKT